MVIQTKAYFANIDEETRARRAAGERRRRQVLDGLNLVYDGNIDVIAHYDRVLK